MRRAALTTTKKELEHGDLDFRRDICESFIFASMYMKEGTGNVSMVNLVDIHA